MTRTKNALIVTMSGLAAAAAAFMTSSAGAEKPRPSEGPASAATAVFAGGCFWCVEADFDKLDGVIDTTSGYAGGHVLNPTYKQVTKGDTGHLEAVRVTYDPAKITYAELADYFIRHIDPVDAGGQFCDQGESYTSAFFTSRESERKLAEAEIAEAAKLLGEKVATRVLAANAFWPAEEYHQDYYKKNPVRYNFYRTSCGRDARLKEVWGDKPAS